MQLATVVLCLALFVSHSNQERYIWPSPIAPRAHLMPLFYADGQPAGEIEPEETEPHEKKFFNSISLPSLPSFSLPSVSLPSISLPSLPSISIPPFPSVALPPRPMPFTITKTIVTTVTSTVSTPITSKCIPSSQFAKGANGGISSTACARRRRDVEEIVEQESISPALPLSLEASAVESMIPEAVGLKELASIPLPEPQVEIQSSQLENNDIEQRKFKNGLATITSIVNTITSYTFVPIIVKKSADVAVASSLLCLPAGYLVC